MKAWRLPLLGLLLLALGMACLRVETHRVDEGYSREAMLDPWLAAGRVLARNGLQVRSVPHYTGLRPQARVLVLATPLDYLDAGEQRALLAWVRAGGHLVAGLQNRRAQAANAQAPLLAALDVRLRERELDEKARQALAQEHGPRPTQLDSEGRIAARFLPRLVLEAGRVAPRWTVSDAYGTHAMRFAVGAGRITVLSDMQWLHNRRLGEGDHGALLWRVVDATPGAEVWLIPGTERPALLALLWETAAPLLVAAALYGLVWLWGVSRRFGPLMQVLPPARRRLTEHLEACGRYLAAHGGLDRLHGASRLRLLAEVQRRHPQWRRLPPAELAARLAARTGLESGAVRRLLECAPPTDLPQFAADLRLINRLRKAL